LLIDVFYVGMRRVLDNSIIKVISKVFYYFQVVFPSVLEQLSDFQLLSRGSAPWS
jgi:hypothetical protein